MQKTPYGFYFNKILGIVPPKNQLCSYLINEKTIQLNKPLVIITYDGVFGFKYINPKIGVDWFLNTGKTDSRHNEYYTAS